jgi:hypothetical protein
MEWQTKINKITELYKLLFQTPKSPLSLMLEKIEGNDSFYKKITINFYKLVTKRRRKMSLFRQMTRAVSVCLLPNSYAVYIKSIESSGHQNVKKAIKNGYTFKTINYNEHLDDIWDIRRSTRTQQGNVPDSSISSRPKASADPKSNTLYHGYPYFGVFDPENKLEAYTGCLLAGEVIEMSHFYGYADHQKNGVVPLLITSIFNHTIENHPQIKAFIYSGYIGASPTLKHFKKKFNFLPYQIKWSLN